MTTPSPINVQKQRNTPEIPGMFRTFAQLSAEKRLSVQALKGYLLNRLPFALLAGAGIVFFIHTGLWEPWRKAAFSWREGLPFDYGGIILHSALCLFLLSAFSVGVLRLYRRESRLLRLFNYGEVARNFTFSDDRRYYTYVDAHGVSHMQQCTQDMLGSSATQKVWSQPEGAHVLFLPERPDICHLVIGKGMDSYRLGKNPNNP